MGPWCVWVPVRLERKAWRAGEFVGTGGTVQVRMSPGMLRSKNLKRVRIKLRSKTGTGVNYEIKCSGGGHSICHCSITKGNLPLNTMKSEDS